MTKTEFLKHHFKRLYITRNHFRANFYHTVALIFVVANVLYFSGIIGSVLNMYIGMFLFVVDYIAEMYDPNPESPGPWFTSHFHRFFGDD